ncbi:MAG: enoyl-ACP reductase [Pelagibacteraceae bacterium TMED237]|nr:MAG: enoyl-ACP reductase [Pelagibacteraceae bacterium TMED237]|tara:strand:+ start:9300 stop:10073 length:774 start_codon:yes stop_codon:yes gene_type:complete
MLKNKKGLVFGIANNHSIAWGISKELSKNNAEIAIGYQNEILLKRVKPLSEEINSKILIECDFNNQDSVNNAVNVIKTEWGTIDFIVHAVAFADKTELNGRYIDTSKDNFINCLEISCYSLTSLVKAFEPIMNEGGSILTLTFYGSNKVIPNYNLMGIAKAALETSVKYLSVDLGKKNIRVNAISAGPMRTIAGAAINNAREVFKFTENHSPLKRNVQLDEVGKSALYFVSDMSSAVTGEVHYVDCGYNIIGMPNNN